MKRRQIEKIIKKETDIIEKELIEKQESSKINQFSEIGRTGLKEYSGYIYEEELRQLSTLSVRQRIYKEMSENDAVIGSILFVVDMLIRQVDWDFQAGGEEQKDIEAKEFIESCFEDMSYSWKETLSEILSFLVYGWSWFETVYKPRDGKNSRFSDGKIGWRKFAIRGQDSLLRWDFDDEGGIKSMVQSTSPIYEEIEIPIEKSLLFRTGLYKQNPEGKSVLRRCYRNWYMKKRVENYEAIGIERDLAGFPILYVPVEWTDDNAPAGLKSAYSDSKELITRIKRDEQEGLVLPSIYDENNNQILKLELLTTGGKRNFDTNQIINRYDQRIAMTVLADFLLLGQQSVGSFALSSDKTNLFSTAIGAWLDIITSVFNRYAIPRLFELNGFDLEKLPELTHGDLEKDDKEIISNFVSRLAQAGIDFTDIDTQNSLRRIANLPEITEEPKVPEITKHLNNQILADREERLLKATEELLGGIKESIEKEQ